MAGLPGDSGGFSEPLFPFPGLGFGSVRFQQVGSLLTGSLARAGDAALGCFRGVGLPAKWPGTGRPLENVSRGRPAPDLRSSDLCPGPFRPRRETAVIIRRKTRPAQP